MIRFLTNEQIDSAIALGNYLVANAPEFLIDKYTKYYLRQSPAAQRSINQINSMLKLALPSWRAPEVVIIYDGKVIVLLLKIDANLYEDGEVFPHEILSKFVAAAELKAEKIVNPSAISGGDSYLANEREGPSLESILDDLNLPEEVLALALPALAISPESSIEILIDRKIGDAKPIQLPPTENLRMPETPPTKKDCFPGKVVDFFHTYNYLVLEDGRVINPSPHSSTDFKLGFWYRFEHAGQVVRFSERVQPVSCDMISSEVEPPYSEHAVNLELFKK